MSVTTRAEIASFGGKLLKLTHHATSTGCDMKFNLFLPGPSDPTRQFPVLIWLSGLTCTPDNCAEKGFLQHGASKKGIAVVYPDTSPRGLGIAGEDDSWDFGSGAGFYVDATTEPWKAGYKMYTYITEELPKVVFSAFPQLDPERVSISGHSMGGHGALILVSVRPFARRYPALVVLWLIVIKFLKNPGKYRSVSAFAPIANPCNCQWGRKAFSGYFGDEDKQAWAEHDATELVKRWKGPLNILIDVGTADKFYHDKQLLPENLVGAAQKAGHETAITVRYQPGYDHSYYTMATFADDHIEHAAKYLLRDEAQ
ncbi:hypothetical protein KEM52_005060 [Ascosphaera acerosa]|nr:hypothetical protein KEM52_005060 [Ascosphaera acerosa]